MILLKDAPIILPDEAPASLNLENETSIQAGISELARNKTVLIVVHRMRTPEELRIVLQRIIIVEEVFLNV